MMKTIFVTCLVALLLAACDYFASGTWDDDPQNWGRAFQSTKPNDVVILHSRYWRSAHWSYEFEYYFEIKSNEQFKKQLFTRNKLKKLEGQEAILAMNKFSGNTPEWFMPKKAEQYEIWVFENDPNSYFRVFVEKETGNLFLTDRQL